MVWRVGRSSGNGVNVWNGNRPSTGRLLLVLVGYGIAGTGKLLLLLVGYMSLVTGTGRLFSLVFC
jgi:hypothetical protein